MCHKWAPSGGQHPLRPRRVCTSIKGSWPGGSGGRSPSGGKIADLFTFTRIFHARRRGGTPPASDASCVSAVERPREGLPCRPPGRLRAGAPLQPASWPHHLSSLLSNKLFPFIRAAAVGRSRPAESSTSLFDRLGVTSSTGTSQVSSAQRIPRRAAALLEKIAAFGPAHIGPLFSPSTAAPILQRLALTLVSDMEHGACGFAGAGMLSASAARQFV